jgi:uncharacterized membrane protein
MESSLPLRRDIRLRNRAIIVLLLPVAIILWMVGWIVFWAASKAAPQRCKTAVEDDRLEISVGPLEEKPQCYN